MIRYLLASAAARARAGKTLFLLTAFGVILGVAAVLSIQIINRNALAAFKGSLEAVSGQADLSILGAGATFPEQIYVTVLADSAVEAAWPIYRAAVSLSGRDQVFLDLVGVDLFQATGLPLDSGLRNIDDVLRVPGWVALTPSFAADLGVEPGDTLLASFGSRRVTLSVGALVDFQAIAPLASSKLAVMDIAQAQALFGSRGAIDQIDVVLRHGSDIRAVRTRLSSTLGAGVEVLTPVQREQRAADLLGAFRLNLTALSLISLFVGLFLVYSSTQASLVRRRAEFGLLRSLGATRGQVLAIIMFEVALLGVVGVSAGLPLGYWVAAENVEAVSATISNLYLLNEIETLELPASLYLLAAAIGIGGALIAALHPALEMSRRDPRALLTPFTLHESMKIAAFPLFVAGTAMLTLTALWFAAVGHTWRPAGFALALILMVSLSLYTPLALELLTGPVRVRRLGLAYSLKTLGARIQTTSVAVASLAVAVSMLIGITLMVGSFRRTVDVWIGTTIRADVYISSESWSRSGNAAQLNDQLVLELSALPGVVAVDRLRSLYPTIEGRRIFLAGVDLSLSLTDRFSLLAGDVDSAGLAARDGGAVLISEPLARRLKLSQGDTLTVPDPGGAVRLPVAGIYYDYGYESGAAVVDLGTMERFFGPGQISNLALYLDDQHDAEATVDAIRARYPDAPLQVRSNRRLRAEVLRIFDQTFAITRILQAMSLIVAATGIALTLIVLARERLSELALYRALGATRPQIFRIFVGKGLAMGVAALVLGAAGGIVLACILIYVVNRSYFGWTIQFHWPVPELAQQAATILFAAVAASIFPALRASRTPASELSRDDL